MLTHITESTCLFMLLNLALHFNFYVLIILHCLALGYVCQVETLKKFDFCKSFGCFLIPVFLCAASKNVSKARMS